MAGGPTAMPAATTPASAMYPTTYDAGSTAALGGGGDILGSLIASASSGMAKVESTLANLQNAAGSQGIDPGTAAQLNQQMQNWANMAELAKKMNEQKQNLMQMILA